MIQTPVFNVILDIIWMLLQINASLVQTLPIVYHVTLLHIVLTVFKDIIKMVLVDVYYVLKIALIVSTILIVHSVSTHFI